MLNKIILIGRLTHDPELRYTSNGTPVANFNLAVDRQFKNQQGEKEVDFIRIVVWRKLAEVCAENIGKGRLIAVEGRLQIGSYEAQDGSKRMSADVVADSVRFLDWPKDKQSTNSSMPDFGEAIGAPDDKDLPF